MNKKLLLVSSFILLASSMAAKENVIKLDQTVVTTENFATDVRRTPANINIVTAEDIEKSGAKDLVQALQNVPGIAVKRYAGTIKFDMRGSNSMYADKNNLITLDGVPVSASQVANLPIETIERVEVIPGGGNILYGDKAVGGVVNVITKSAQDKDFYGNVYAEGGNEHYKKAGLNVGTKIGENLFLETGYTHSNPSVWRDGEKYKDQEARVRTKYTLDKGDVEFKYTHLESENKRGVAVPRVVRRKDPGFLSGGKVNSNDFYLKYRQEIGDDLELLTYGNYYERKNSSYNRKTDEYNRKNNDERKYAKVQIKQKYMDNNYFIIGTDYLDEEIKPYKGSQNSVKHNYGVFGKNKIVYDKFEFVQGLRYDRADYDFYWRNGSLTSPEKILHPKDSQKYDDYSAEFAVNYLYSDTGSTYISYNRGFRTPTVGEIRYTLHSAKLKAQVQDTVEIGVKDYVADTYVSLATYYRKTKDELYSTIPPEFYGMVNYNVGDTRRVGVEGFAEHYFGDLTVNGSLTYIDHKITKAANPIYKNSHIPSVPNWKLTAGANYNITPELNVGMDWLYYSKSFDLDDIANERGKTVNGYSIFNLSACYDFGNGLTISGRIENIFDKKYDEYAGYWDDDYGHKGTYEFRRQYYPAIGRNYSVGFNYKF